MRSAPVFWVHEVNSAPSHLHGNKKKSVRRVEQRGKKIFYYALQAKATCDTNRARTKHKSNINLIFIGCRNPS